MKRLLLLAGLVLIPVQAAAQDKPKAEVFGGYSYFHSDGGGNLNGWNASASINLYKWIDVIADFGGHYGSDSASITTSVIGFPNISVRANADSSVHTFMGGPGFYLRTHSRFTPFTHFLFGAARVHSKGSFSATVGDLVNNIDFSITDTGFAMAIGGGLDLKITDSFALRLIQPDYLLARVGRNNQSNARISAGIVFRFGSR